MYPKTMNKKQEEQFDKLVPHLTAISTELAEERRKKIKQFISTLLKAERQEIKRAVEEILQRAKTGNMKFDWALDEIIHSIKADTEKIIKRNNQKQL